MLGWRIRASGEMSAGGFAPPEHCDQDNSPTSWQLRSELTHDLCVGANKDGEKKNKWG